MEPPVTPPTQQPEWFENFIANYDTQNPKQGETLQATIIRSDQDGIVLDLGLKREIVVPQRDLEHLAPEMLEKLTPGTQIPVVVTSEASEDRDMEVSLSRGLEQQVWDDAHKSMQDGEILSLEVVDHNRGGLIVRYESLRGFVPYSLVPELHGVRNPKRADAIKAGMVGKTIDVKITEVDPEKRRLILSSESAQAELRQHLLDKFKKGQTHHGNIVKVVDFGAFVDLGGIDGLIHISQLSWKKVKHPSEAVKIGDEVDVKIIEVDRERQRIGLSRKALLPGPWQTLNDEVKVGDYLEGIVTRLVEFGAFAKIPQGVEGLIHTSQIGYSAHQDPQNAIKPGDRVLVKVLDIKPERKRIALSMRQVPMERQIAWSLEIMEEEPEPTKELEVETTSAVEESPAPLMEPEVETPSAVEESPAPLMEPEAETTTAGEETPAPLMEPEADASDVVEESPAPLMEPETEVLSADVEAVQAPEEVAQEPVSSAQPETAEAAAENTLPDVDVTLEASTVDSKAEPSNGSLETETSPEPEKLVEPAQTELPG
jgi:small subunit ribosomal protein S1